jgi:RimJ/RimL family protein N-acetyltransferase
VTARRAPVPLPDPPLADDLVQLRPWQDADAPCLVRAWGDPEVTRWTGVPTDTSLAAARRWISGDAHRRALGLALDLVIDVDGAVAGEVGLADIDVLAGTADIGWWVAPEHRGVGLAARAGRLLASWAVGELCVATVVARCHPDNPASGAAARAAGFAPAVPDGPDGPSHIWRFT